MLKVTLFLLQETNLDLRFGKKDVLYCSAKYMLGANISFTFQWVYVLLFGVALKISNFRLSINLESI